MNIRVSLSNFVYSLISHTRSLINANTSHNDCLSSVYYNSLMPESATWNRTVQLPIIGEESLAFLCCGMSGQTISSDVLRSFPG